MSYRNHYMCSGQATSNCKSVKSTHNFILVFYSVYFPRIMMYLVFVILRLSRFLLEFVFTFGWWIPCTVSYIFNHNSILKFWIWFLIQLNHYQRQNNKTTSLKIKILVLLLRFFWSVGFIFFGQFCNGLVIKVEKPCNFLQSQFYINKKT